MESLSSEDSASKPPDEASGSVMVWSGLEGSILLQYKEVIRHVYFCYILYIFVQ